MGSFWNFAQIFVTFIAAGLFFSWLAFSIARLRRSNHDIRNQLTTILLTLDVERDERNGR